MLCSTWLVFALAAAWIWPAPPPVQAPADFSGAWIAIPPATPTPQPLGLYASPAWGSETLVSQTGETITIEYTSNGRSHAKLSFVFNLDGTPTTNLDAGVEPRQRLSTAEWQGRSLVLTMSVDWPRGDAGTPRVLRQVLTLETPTTLRIDATLTYRGQTATTTLRCRRTPTAQRPPHA